MIELRAQPDDYVFKNSLGDPIDQRSFYKIFCAAQRTLGIRLRDLYATKDTYISAALTQGVNLTWLSERTRVMETTLRTPYGRFIHASQAGALELARIDPLSPKTRRLPHDCPTEGQPKKGLELRGNFGGAEGI